MIALASPDPLYLVEAKTFAKRTWPYRAGELAGGGHIDNWRRLDIDEKPEAGDIAAYKLSGGGSSFSGHTGIIISEQVGAFGVFFTELNNVSAHGDAVYGVWNQFMRNPDTRYRRYTGD